jgi:multicomponent Na+:H+ antiporter subunit F
MDWVTGIVLALLIGSGVLVFVRLVRGPSMLDRAVAVDALLAVVAAGLGARAAEGRTPYTLPVLLVLAFLGFTGSVAVARFIALRDPEEGRTVEGHPIQSGHPDHVNHEDDGDPAGGRPDPREGES